jgi:outer membrane receptor protein involved in Fe transport
VIAHRAAVLTHPPVRHCRSLHATGAVLSLAAALWRASVHAQTLPPTEGPSLQLAPPVVVTATRLPESLADVPAALSVVDQADIQDARATVTLDESLNRVPGVLVQNSDNFAQDTRIQIRGFGTRAAFGTREVRILLDGLPETCPTGRRRSPTSTSEPCTGSRCCAAPHPRSTGTPRAA